MSRVRFSKPALSLTNQIALLESRGMLIEDHKKARHYLRFIGYYRLSGYWHPFQNRDGGSRHDSFKPETRFEEILDIYIFDRQLRVLIMDALERVEVAARTVISNVLSERFGPHGFMDAGHFRREFSHDNFMSTVSRAMEQNKDVPPVMNYRKKYCSPSCPPCWITFEIMSFGMVSKVFKGLRTPEQQAVSRQFALPPGRLASWLHAMSHLRNVCAHHGRVWNRRFRIKPSVAKPERHHVPDPEKFYNHAVVIQTMMTQVSGDAHWAGQLEDILSRHPRIAPERMGFPPAWRGARVWRP